MMMKRARPSTDVGIVFPWSDNEFVVIQRETDLNLEFLEADKAAELRELLF